MDDKPTRRPEEDAGKVPQGSGSVLVAVLLAPLRLLGWLIGWDKESGLGGTAKTVIYAILIALAVRTILYEPFNIPSGSMKPTLLVGDYLFVSKFSYGYSRFSVGFGLDVPLFDGRLLGSEPERGDVAVFRKPTDTSLDFIKRVVGLPGDEIQIRGGVLHINGEAVSLEPALPFFDASCAGGREVDADLETLPNGAQHLILGTQTLHPFDDTPVYIVPAGHFFMMGDNRDRSNDSRAMADVGFVPAENMIGRAEFIFFSADGCGSLFKPWTWPASIRWSRLFQSVE